MSDAKQFKQGDFCWNELMTSDASKSKQFYADLFNWKAQDNDMGGFTYTMFQHGENEIAGMMQIPKEKAQHMPSNWMSYIYVDNLDEMVTKATSLGAKVTVDKQEIPNIGHFAVIQDPAGAHIALWQSLR